MKLSVRWLALGFLAVSLILPSLRASAESPPALAGMVTDALANNPELRAAKSRWEMAQHRVSPPAP